MSEKQIEVLEKIGTKDGNDICQAILHDSGKHYPGYVINHPDGRGVWVETNPLEWNVLEWNVVNKGAFAGSPESAPSINNRTGF